MGSLNSIKTALIAFFHPAEGWQLPLSRSLSGHIKDFCYERSTWSKFISTAQSKMGRCLMFSHNGDIFTIRPKFRNKQMKDLKGARTEMVTIKIQH